MDKPDYSLTWGAFFTEARCLAQLARERRAEALQLAQTNTHSSSVITSPVPVPVALPRVPGGKGLGS